MKFKFFKLFVFSLVSSIFMSASCLSASAMEDEIYTKDGIYYEDYEDNEKNEDIKNFELGIWSVIEFQYDHLYSKKALINYMISNLNNNKNNNKVIKMEGCVFNELNFDFVKEYVDSNLKCKNYKSNSEEQYESYYITNFINILEKNKKIECFDFFKYAYQVFCNKIEEKQEVKNITKVNIDDKDSKKIIEEIAEKLKKEGFTKDQVKFAVDKYKKKLSKNSYTEDSIYKLAVNLLKLKEEAFSPTLLKCRLMGYAKAKSPISEKEAEEIIKKLEKEDSSIWDKQAHKMASILYDPNSYKNMCDKKDGGSYLSYLQKVLVDEFCFSEEQALYGVNRLKLRNNLINEDEDKFSYEYDSYEDIYKATKNIILSIQNINNFSKKELVSYLSNQIRTDKCIFSDDKEKINFVCIQGYIDYLESLNSEDKSKCKYEIGKSMAQYIEDFIYILEQNGILNFCKAALNMGNKLFQSNELYHDKENCFFALINDFKFTEEEVKWAISVIDFYTPFNKQDVPYKNENKINNYDDKGNNQTDCYKSGGNIIKKDNYGGYYKKGGYYK